MFEMLGLFEEALIQYDEIDALLTQLVINSNFGGKTRFVSINRELLFVYQYSAHLRSQNLSVYSFIV